MKRSEELKIMLKNLKEENNEMLQKMVRSKCSEDGSNYDKLLNEYWRVYGSAASDKMYRLKCQIWTEERREVEVGDGVTLCLYSDAHAYTVIAKTAKTITIQRDKATLSPDFKPEFIPGGFAAHCTNQDEQKWSYERDPNGDVLKCRWSEKRGMFVYKGCQIRNGRHEYYDYNF